MTLLFMNVNHVLSEYFWFRILELLVRVRVISITPVRSESSTYSIYIV